MTSVIVVVVVVAAIAVVVVAVVVVVVAMVVVATACAIETEPIRKCDRPMLSVCQLLLMSCCLTSHTNYPSIQTYFNKLN